MHLKNHTPESPLDPLVQKMIPVLKRQIGSWEVAVNRRSHNTKDLADQYDAASTRWHKTAHDFDLETAYQGPLQACGAPTVLAKTGTQARVLDCGVGSGSLSIALNSLSPNRAAFYGIDISAAMLGAAKTEMQKAGISPQLEQADILNIPHEDQSFNVVMAAHVLEHLSDPQQAVAEMVRVLKPGGVLFACMTRRSIFGALVQLRWRTWAVTEQQGVAWLRGCHLVNIGFQPVSLGPCVGQATTAFWAHKPAKAS
jgi:demethylmenaquinone methyltransferase/2-methoxy-6-polyprenyl-1,4-benzoquinol methylase